MKRVGVTLGLAVVTSSTLGAQGQRLTNRAAETRFVKLARSQCGNFSVLRAHPHTGRTHQIRVHSMALGHPLIGDVLYGGQKENPAFPGISARVCLHAESISITHPATQLPMTFSAPLPEDLLKLIEVLAFGPVK